MQNIPKKQTLEPNDLDTIYKVLKKAGEMSAATEKSQMSGTTSSNLLSTPMDIPVVNINVPDYPDREPRISTGATTRGPQIKSLGPPQKQGLTAPLTDISCSGPKFFIKAISYILMHTKSFCPFFILLTCASLLQ